MASPYPVFLPDIATELEALGASAPMVPSKLRRFFLLLIRGHWSDSGNYGPDLADTLQCLEWSPDNQDFKVELQGSVVPITTQHMIWVSVGNFRPRQVTFGNRAQPPDDTNATEQYVLPSAAEVLVQHSAPSLDVAFDMAWSTFCFFVGFQEVILNGIGREGSAFRPVLVGEPQMKEPDPKSRFRVDVGAQLSLNVAVATTVESHILKRVALSVVNPPSA